MKKLSFLFACLLTSSLIAMYQSNPLTPEIISEGFFLCEDAFVGVRAGYQFDDVFNRRLVLGRISGQVDHSEIMINQGVLTFNFFDKVDIWGSLGAANFHFADEINPAPGFIGPPLKLEYKTHNDLIWGAGARATLFSYECATFGVSGGYLHAHPDLHWMTSDGMPIFHTGHLKYREWQLGAAVCYQVGFFNPTACAIHRS